MEDPMVAPVSAKQRQKQKVQEKPRERCARCGVPISRRLTPFVWHQHVVCEHCHGKLRAYEPAMAICPGAKPVLRYARGAKNDDRPRGKGRWMVSFGRKLVGMR
jgi:ribosomal protein L37AE/L43A